MIWTVTGESFCNGPATCCWRLWYQAVSQPFQYATGFSKKAQMYLTATPYSHTSHPHLTGIHYSHSSQPLLTATPPATSTTPYSHIIQPHKPTFASTTDLALEHKLQHPKMPRARSEPAWDSTALLLARQWTDKTRQSTRYVHKHWQNNGQTLWPTLLHFMWLQPSFFCMGDLQLGHGLELVTNHRQFAASSVSCSVPSTGGETKQKYCSSTGGETKQNYCSGTGGENQIKLL